MSSRKNGKVAVVRTSDLERSWSTSPEIRRDAIANALATANAPAKFLPTAGELVMPAGGRHPHFVVKVAKDGIHFSAECGRAFAIGEASTDLLGACAYCKDGDIAPLDAQDEKPLKVREPREPKPAPELDVHDRRVVFIYEASVARLAELAPTYDALVAKVAQYRKLLPKSVRASTPAAGGPKAARVDYGITPDRESDSPELATIRTYANAGDERAQAIIAHVDSWVDADGKAVSTIDKLASGVCSTCNSDKHLRRTGFFSAAREIAKMAERKVVTLAA